MKSGNTKAAIPQDILEKLYTPHKTKEALALLGVCPDCGTALEVVDTWERLCKKPACGYNFNWHGWPQLKRQERLDG